jgi:phosphoserine phosphatase
MISVIIPALNEAATIGAVVEFAWRSPGVSDVLVLDDGSIDDTAGLARAAGARVLTSTLLGKGASMEDGSWEARGDVLVFLDGDLSSLEEDLIPRLVEPIAAGRADFVKARFSRRGGRVTTLTARPLLAMFFPELAHFEQPLGGIVAARRAFLRNLSFETDYGVDVGLLIDAAMNGGRVAEVDVGHIEHESQPLEALRDMARHVVRVILDRAARYGRLHIDQVREVEEVERRAQAELPAVLGKARAAGKLALFDMDGVLLRDRFVVRLAQRVNKLAELRAFLDHPTLSAEQRTQAIGALFAGVPRELFEQTARNLALVQGAAETVIALRKAGYRVGIVTDSYRAAAEVVRRRVFADFSLSHQMRFRRGVATGEVALSPAMAHPSGCERHACCKLNALLHLAERLGLPREEIVAVGDGENDVCMLRAAGRSVAFEPKTPAVAEAAQHVVEGDLLGVLDVLGDEVLARSA